MVKGAKDRGKAKENAMEIANPVQLKSFGKESLPEISYGLHMSPMYHKLRVDFEIGTLIIVLSRIVGVSECTVIYFLEI